MQPSGKGKDKEKEGGHMDAPKSVQKAVQSGEVDLLPEVRQLPVGYYVPSSAFRSQQQEEEEEVMPGSIVRVGAVDSTLLANLWRITRG